MSKVLHPALYVVATPIGNLDDLSDRARKVLSAADLIAAEDTRHSGRLLQHFGIHRPMIALHEHNERDRCDSIIAAVEAGQAVALISDAGTPLISDPGYVVLCAMHAKGLSVVPIPGPSSLIAALSVAGLPTDRFVFEGFLPARATARRQRLEHLRSEARTLVLLESCHRIDESLHDLVDVFGPERSATLARELTKLHEEICHATLGALCAAVHDGTLARRGEFVVLIAGSPETTTCAEREALRLVEALLDEGLSVKRAAALAAAHHGVARKPVYQHALAHSAS